MVDVLIVFDCRCCVRVYLFKFNVLPAILRTLFATLFNGFIREVLQLRRYSNILRSFQHNIVGAGRSLSVAPANNVLGVPEENLRILPRNLIGFNNRCKQRGVSIL